MLYKKNIYRKFSIECFSIENRQIFIERSIEHSTKQFYRTFYRPFCYVVSCYFRVICMHPTTMTSNNFTRHCFYQYFSEL